MLDLSTWSRADVISAIALIVSCLAFVASGVSSLAAWLSYRAAKSAVEPAARAYFEPFEDGTEWWILHTEINNRSPFMLELLQMTFLQPIGAKFTKYVGGYSGAASDGEPMMYTLPAEVNSEPMARTISSGDLEEIEDLEFASQETRELTTLIVRMPKARFWRRNVVLRISVQQHLAFARRKHLYVGLPFPKRATVRHRY